MSKILYEPQRITGARSELVARCEQILSDQARQGYTLTLRQLYYRLIAADAFPDSRRQEIAPGQFTKNHISNYKWLGDLLTKARIGGMIDWNYIEDRTRGHSGGDSGWSSPAAAIRSIPRWYGISHWDGQPEYLEVWVEKDALSDVVGRPANRWDVAHMACKGSPSTSVMHDAAVRLREIEDEDREVTILYLGDHDPTGIDIPRDIEDRLRLFNCNATVKRIALNMDQIEALNPPPSPAKETDSRTTKYVERFGTEDTWELDALEPAALDNLIDAEIRTHIYQDLRQERLDQEEREKRLLVSVADNLDVALAHLRAEGLLDEGDG
jgi:hypothetical protein